jgi:hypothetical protein
MKTIIYDIRVYLLIKIEYYYCAKIIFFISCYVERCIKSLISPPVLNLSELAVSQLLDLNTENVF